jgi:lysophospholipid acyltransferase (LPLAT)-like uncharacterized protein
MSPKAVFKLLFKTPAARTFMCWLIATYIRFVYYSSVRNIVIHKDAGPYMRGELPAVFAFWHGRLLLMPMIRPQGRKMHVFTSNHRDGEMMARTMNHFGFGTVRGSSTRGGARGAKQAIRALKAGDNVSITPDGPKGPALKVQPGLLILAHMTGVPVIPVTYASSRYKQIRSWDKFMLALPFGRIHYSIGAPLLNVTKEVLEEEMLRLTCEVDAL